MSLFQPQFKIIRTVSRIGKTSPNQSGRIYGSFHGGSALNESVLKRRDPIPFREMGSINPIAITAKLWKRSSTNSTKDADSMYSDGQFCTQPGLLLTVDGEHTDAFIKEPNKALKEQM